MLSRPFATPSDSPPSFSCAALIKEIGRGARGARSLARADAHRLYAAILAGEVSELELGAVLLAYRIKGESAEELAGMCDAADAVVHKLDAVPGPAPVVIASYNGARRQANLVPLLALLLARAGVPVLVHGIASDAGRVTTAEVFAALQVGAAPDIAAAQRALAERRLAFVTIDTLAPALAAQLALRERLGVRNSAHTLVKLLQPFRQPALRLVNYTHPPYRDVLMQYFTAVQPVAAPGVLLARGTEGEAVADATLARETWWLRDGAAHTVIEAGARLAPEAQSLPASREAGPTADWIREVLAGKRAAPAPIAMQLRAIAQAVGAPASADW